MSINPMATSVVILSSPGLYDASLRRHYFTTAFKPTDNVAGRACYLKVCQLGVQQTTAAHPLDDLSTWALGISGFPQPLSYHSVNNAQPRSSGTVTTGAYIQKDHSGPLVGILSASHTNYTPSQSCIFPRCLVQIPLCQHEVTVFLTKLNGAVTNTTALESLTVVFELTPVDGDSPPILNP